MKHIISYILILSILLYGCSSTSNLPSNQQTQQQQEQQTVTDIIVGVAAFMVVMTTVVWIVVHHAVKKQKAQAAADEAKFQSCIGKTKSEVYEMYGPPNSIVDDGQGAGRHNTRICHNIHLRKH